MTIRNITYVGNRLQDRLMNVALSHDILDATVDMNKGGINMVSWAHHPCMGWYKETTHIDTMKELAMQLGY